MSGKRILLVEDERDMAELVAMRLRKEFYEVDVAHDGLEAMSKLRRVKPDAVLLDIMLPRLSGLEVLRKIRSDHELDELPVIMLTARGEDADIVAGLNVGADDYVTKPFSMAVLVARVAAVLRRDRAPGDEDAAVLTAGPIKVDQNIHQVTVSEDPVPLTLTEFRLLAAIISAKGRVLTRDQLISRAISPDAVVVDRTIDVHMTALRRKLGQARDYIKTVRGVGYQLATQ